MSCQWEKCEEDFGEKDFEEYGASGRIRTSDRSVRSRVLYPAELRMHRENLFYC